MMMYLNSFHKSNSWLATEDVPADIKNLKRTFSCISYTIETTDFSFPQGVYVHIVPPGPQKKMETY
jgi:hypothetical protein